MKLILMKEVDTDHLILKCPAEDGVDGVFNFAHLLDPYHLRE